MKMKRTPVQFRCAYPIPEAAENRQANAEYLYSMTRVGVYAELGE
jgi:hypothetical protein